MNDRALYTIKEARELLGGMGQNTMYRLLNRGDLPTVVIGSRRFISAEAIADLIERSTTRVIPTKDAARFRKPNLKGINTGSHTDGGQFSSPGQRRLAWPRRSPAFERCCLPAQRRLICPAGLDRLEGWRLLRISLVLSERSQSIHVGHSRFRVGFRLMAG